MHKIKHFLVMTALLMSTMIVNSTCWFKVYQEKLPETFDKLKK